MEATAEKWDAEARKAALIPYVQQAQRDGWRVEAQTDFTASLAKGHRTNHLLHVILSVLTLGLWLIVWAIVAVVNKEQRRLIAVDEYGKVTG